MKIKIDMKRQAMRVSIKELRDLADELEKEAKATNADLGLTLKNGINLNQSWCLAIINEHPEQSDTWRFE